MNDLNENRIQSDHLNDFARIMEDDMADPGHLPVVESAAAGSPAKKLNINEENVKKGLGGLVLTLVKLLHELMERQAIRLMDTGSLYEDEIEKLGNTLMLQAQEIDRLREAFGLEEEDLNLDLGPLGKLL